MDAIIIAGGESNPEDPLYPYTEGNPKALLDIAGKPMVQWILDAFNGAEKIGNIIVVGLKEVESLTSQKPIYFLPAGNGMIDNIRIGTEKVQELNPETTHVVVSSADIPALTAEMVDWVVENCSKTDHDLYYHAVEKQVMEARFPGSNRSYIKLKGMEVCGGDLNVVAVWAVTAKEDLWNELAGARKNPFRQAAIVGLDTLLLVILRAVDINQAAAKVSKNIGLRGRGILSPYAEIAMDVDKPHQLEILREDLKNKSAS
jgi:GTP:adenosylcobinamide-phosphate guanylyltransferase